MYRCIQIIDKRLHIYNNLRLKVVMILDDSLRTMPDQKTQKRVFSAYLLKPNFNKLNIFR